VISAFSFLNPYPALAAIYCLKPKEEKTDAEKTLRHAIFSVRAMNALLSLNSNRGFATASDYLQCHALGALLGAAKGLVLLPCTFLLLFATWGQL